MASTSHEQVNNEIYHELGSRWYTAQDDPIALLRAEARSRNPWILREIREAFPRGNPRVLDVGCGGGFLSNALAAAGLAVTGLDASPQSLEIAEQFDTTGSVHYQLGDANHLPFGESEFDAACAMDFLEHVENPAQIVREIARVLPPGGLFFFHTINRNFLSWLIGIKGVEWFVKNTPPNLHLYRYFIKPVELRRYCEDAGFEIRQLFGSAPVITNTAFWKLLATGCVDDNFQFTFVNSKLLGYLGLARKM